MKIAFIVPSLANRGPVLVVRELIEGLVKEESVTYVKLFYFDKLEEELRIEVEKEQIDKFTPTRLGNYDIIHSHGLRPDKYVFDNKKYIQGICITTMHNIIRAEYKANYNGLVAFSVEKLWRHFLRRHDIIVSLTEVMAQYYRKLLPKKRVEVVYNGRTVINEKVDRTDFDLISALSTQYKILGTSCVVTKRKGLHQVIKALPNLQEYAFVVIGNGPELSSLIRVAKESEVYERCLFLGARSNASRYCPLFHMYVLPSYIEGLPLAMLEATAYGLPIICSSINVHQEIFSNEEVGFFDLDNLESLIDAVRRVERKHTAYSNNAHKRYLENYTSQKMVKHYLNLYSLVTK